MRSIIACIVFIILVGLSFGQSFDLDTVPYFQYSDEITSSGAALKWAVQLPAKADRSLYVMKVAIYCDATCEATQSVNGTASTTTEVAGIALNLPQPAVGKFYKNSDSTGGTAIKPISIPAGATVPQESSIVLRKGSDTAQNYLISVQTANGNRVRVFVKTAEKAR